MKKMMLFLAVGLSVVYAPVAQTQTPVCGVSAPDLQRITERLQENLARLESGQVVTERNVIKYVPIHFHLVGDNTGQGRISEGRVLDQLCKLNEEYAPINVQFYLSPHPTYGIFSKSIAANNVYNMQTNTPLMDNRRHDNALNVYVVEAAESGNPLPNSITLGYTDVSEDWIVIRKSETNGNAENGTLGHEIGHFFNLLHTFNGWDYAYFNEDHPSWPVAPSISPTGVPTELMSGFNCNTAGDYICDTPPDYNLAWDDCSEYTGGAKDPQSVLINPMENNFMSYFPNCTNYAFTNGQSNIIVADLNHPSRNYLDNTFSPSTTPIVPTAAMLEAPVNGAVTPGYSQVQLRWHPVPGATYYLVEADIVPFYSSPETQRFVVTDTSKLLLDLLPNKNYFWRVRPFNRYDVCAASIQRTFKTPTISTGIDEISGITGWDLAPNPVVSGQDVRLTIRTDQSIQASIGLFSAAGQQLQLRSNLTFPSGDTTLTWPTDGLANGIYYLVMENASGRTIRKLVLLR